MAAHSPECICFIIPMFVFGKSGALALIDQSSYVALFPPALKHPCFGPVLGPGMNTETSRHGPLS